jgi:phage tail-like protein
VRDESQQDRGHSPDRSPCSLSHVTDVRRCYPGESVTLRTRVRAREPVHEFTLRIALPDELTPGSTRAPGEAVPQVGLGTGTRYLLWNTSTTPGVETYDYEVEATVAHVSRDTVARSRAVVTSGIGDARSLASEETASIAVLAKGGYLKHLPSLYEADELMGRFLMLFESFWSPIQRQIENLPMYFDPRMTPPEFLPWLASWVGLVLDDRWSEEQKRRLIGSAVSLYRMRGTRRGMQEYLEILAPEVQIVEHRSNNLVVGPGSRLGPAVALGMDNVPNTFTVTVRLPSDPTPADEGERAQHTLQVRRMITAIIEAQKPAHAGYVLRVDTGQPASQTGG